MSIKITNSVSWRLILLIIGFLLICTIVTLLSINGVKSCPDGYLWIPGNRELLTKSFCVARFEMKREGERPVSKASGKPWIDVSRNQAINICASLGPLYQLLTNDQWQTIARNIESVPTNWSSGVVGIKYINIGNFASQFGGVVEGSPCATEGFDVAYPECTVAQSSDFLRKRSHNLTTGEVIWDIGGNAPEWVSTNTSSDFPGDFRGPPCALKGLYKRNFGPQGTYDRPCDDKNTDGFGCIEGEYGAVIFRGGSYNWENSPWQTCPGIFYANTNSFWDANKTGPGFRCAYNLD